MPKFEIHVETSDAVTASEVLHVLKDAVEREDLPISNVSVTSDIEPQVQHDDSLASEVIVHGVW